FAEAFAERSRIARGGIGRPNVDEADDRHRRLLRARRERPGGRRTAEQCDELAPLHSITSSARNSIACENSSPSVFAVFRMLTVGKRVGRPQGKSSGFQRRAIRLT